MTQPKRIRELHDEVLCTCWPAYLIAEGNRASRLPCTAEFGLGLSSPPSVQACIIDTASLRSLCYFTQQNLSFNYGDVFTMGYTRPARTPAAMASCAERRQFASIRDTRVAHLTDS